MMTSFSRELLKWLALVLMTLDHANKAMHLHLPGVPEASRIAFPLFALVLAYGQAQPGARLRPALLRLLAFGALAQPLHAVTVVDGWLPLNVLLTFAAAVAVIMLWMRGQRFAAAALFALGSPWVDYGWAGVGLTLAAWWWFHVEAHGVIFGRCARWAGGALVLAAFALLCAQNGNLWALLALPLVAALSRLPGRFPRWRWAFYGYYVGHLAVLAFAAG